MTAPLDGAPLGIVGAGAFGGALAVALSGTGRVVLWGRDAAAMEGARETRALPRLPGIALAKAITPTADAADLAPCGTVIFAVPTQALAPTLAALPDLSPSFAVAACKGVELGTLRGPTAILAQALPGAVTAILSGPSFAADIARGLPTALSLGCTDPGAGATIQGRLATPSLRLYRTTDVIGVELGGALKNVIAIACGAAIGAGQGESARAALMTRGMAEMTRLAFAMGARPATLSGLSGLGDLALTCASPQSRNFALGLSLGRGDPRPAATAEGIPTARAALDLANRHAVPMPITDATCAVLSGAISVDTAIADLLSRDLTEE